MEISFEGPTFYHQIDEDVFFGWIYKLPDYIEIKGKGSKLFLELNDDVSEDTISQLKAIFVRWNIDSDALSELIKTNPDFDFSDIRKQLHDAANKLLVSQGKEPMSWVESEPPYCSFCGKGKKEYSQAVQGPEVIICDQCVTLSQKILDEGMDNI